MFVPSNEMKNENNITNFWWWYAINPLWRNQ